MTCNCIDAIDAELVEHKLDIAIMLREGQLTSETFTVLFRRDNGRKETRSSKPKIFAHKFCPFCGIVYGGGAAEAENPWRPIETAPQDGSYILAARFGGANDLHWAKHSRWVTASEACEADFGLDASNYHAGWTDGEDETELAFPTHWMPLSSPRAVEGGAV